jgi:hypothetical protein
MVGVPIPIAADDDRAALLDELLKRMPGIATAVNAFTSDAVQQKAFDALLATIPIASATHRPVATVLEQSSGSNGHATVRRRGAKVVAGSDDASERRKRRIGIPKAVDLNLRPDGKAAFRDFVLEKSPSGALEQNTVAAYYVGQELGIQPVTMDHVHTCYLDVDWRLPANMQNSLSKTANRGWLESGDRDNVKLTAPGINLVRYDLPRKKS